MNTAIVKHKKTNLLYRHIEGNVFRNIITGVEGEVHPDVAKNIFSISPDATGILNKYPIVEKLINAVELKMEV